jgi:hypothetical protein
MGKVRNKIRANSRSGRVKLRIRTEVKFRVRQCVGNGTAGEMLPSGPKLKNPITPLCFSIDLFRGKCPPSRPFSGVRDPDPKHNLILTQGMDLIMTENQIRSLQNIDTSHHFSPGTTPLQPLQMASLSSLLALKRTHPK